jgi:hypothetical protein
MSEQVLRSNEPFSYSFKSYIHQSHSSSYQTSFSTLIKPARKTLIEIQVQPRTFHSSTTPKLTNCRRRANKTRACLPTEVRPGQLHNYVAKVSSNQLKLWNKQHRNKHSHNYPSHNSPFINYSYFILVLKNVYIIKLLKYSRQLSSKNITRIYCYNYHDCTKIYSNRLDVQIDHNSDGRFNNIN